MTDSTAPLADKDARILVVGGAGTIGSSTALHLLRRGYSNVRILDVYPSPSGNSAGNDLNKICGNDRGLGIWGDISDEAWEGWTHDPVFQPYCHSVGKLDLACGDTPRAAQLRRKYNLLQSLGRKDVEWLSDGDAIKRKAGHLADANIETWNGLWCGEGGWVAAHDALDSVGRELASLGIKTAFGPSGTFVSLLLSEDGKTCTGVKAADGTEWPADLVVFAAGAWSPVLLDLQGQCESKAWIYAHIQLTPEEAEQLKGIPTMYNDEYGFFMEPSATGLLKFCNEFAGYTHYTTATPFPLTEPVRISVPRSHAAHPTDTIPTESLEDIKRLIAKTISWLSGRPLINQALCWCTDTPDAQWLLCEDPRWKGLVLATGDSGHSFKTLPVAGKQVVDLIEGVLAPERKHAWRWRPGHGNPNGTGRGGPRPKDLADVPGWKHD